MVTQGTYYQLHLQTAFAQGLFNQTVIDQAIMRLYSALIDLGYFGESSRPCKTVLDKLEWSLWESFS
jgi:hypothetical protein